MDVMFEKVGNLFYYCYIVGVFSIYDSVVSFCCFLLNVGFNGVYIVLYLYGERFEKDEV